MQLKILFIGNSHTYLHKMPWIIAEMAAAENRDCAIFVEQCTGNGIGLKDHWHNRTTRDTIANKAWDTVVLQERSGGPLEDGAALKRYTVLQRPDHPEKSTKNIHEHEQNTNETE